MEDINGNKINEAQEIGTRRYIVKINNRFFVDFKENENDKRGKGAYSNGAFNLISPTETDIIVVSTDIKKAHIFEGKINLKSIIDKLLNNMLYKFYTIEIVEQKKGEKNESSRNQN